MSETHSQLFVQTFCIGLKLRGEHPRNPSVPVFVFGLQVHPQQMYFSELTLLL